MATPTEDVQTRSERIIANRIQRTRDALVDAGESEGVGDVDLIMRDLEEALLIFEFRARKRTEKRRDAAKRLIGESCAPVTQPPRYETKPNPTA